MKHRAPTPFLLIAMVVLAWSGNSLAQSCANGKTLYNKTNASVPTACGNSNCHKANVSAKKISNGAGNPSAIENALDGTGANAEMVILDLRNNLPLTTSDIADLANYIFYGSQGLACPAVVPTPASLSASPTSWGFGNVNVGASGSKTISIANSGGTAAASVAVSSNSARFTTSGCSTGTIAAAPGSCTLTVTYTPTAAAADNGTISVAYTGGTTLQIAVSGTGVTSAPLPASLRATPASAAFGSVNVGVTSGSQTITISNIGGSTATGITFVNGNAAEFPVSGNSCTATLAVGPTCSLTVAYRPTAAGADNATLTVNYAGGSLPIALSGNGVSAMPGQLSLPVSLAMGNQNVGSPTAVSVVTVSNTGGTAVTVTNVTSSNPGEFSISNSNCSSVSAGAFCQFSVTFQPSAAGARTSSITLASTGAGSPQTLIATGTGVDGTQQPATVNVIEYYHAAFDHYFITSVAGEIAKLDNGTFVGWTRTGKQFKVSSIGTTGMSAVCRFFSTAFDPKSSHFYTAQSTECTTVKSNASWLFEAEVFSVRLPAVDGSCPPGTIPVYRMYNNGKGGAPNHRFSIDPAVRTQMLASGSDWIPEGSGIGVTMCVTP